MQLPYLVCGTFGLFTMIKLRTKEIYRFLGYRSITPSPEIDERIKACTERMQAAATPKCYYSKFSVTQEAPDITNIAGLRIKSKNLYKNLSGCDYAYMFAATVGLGIDHLIKRGEISSIMDAAIYQAAGAEMIESYADSEIARIRETESQNGYILRPRYSPGYGDLPLALQSDFESILNMQKWCGITLTDTLLMVPSKSITAFIGCTKKPIDTDESSYLAEIVNPIEATGLDADGASGTNNICRDRQSTHNDTETSCTLCSKSADCQYKYTNIKETC